MSSKTLLETIKAVTGELGFSQPTSVLSSQVLTDIQLKQLAVAAGEELLDVHDWQALIKKHTFLVTADSLYTLPADFHRMIDQTFFIGADEINTVSTLSWTRLSPNEKQFRIQGDWLELFDAGQFLGLTASFYYVSKNFVVDGTSSLLKPDFQQDADKTVFSPRLFTNFVKLKMLQIKNLDSRAAAQDFNAALEAAISNDTPSSVLNLDGDSRLVPYTDWSL